MPLIPARAAPVVTLKRVPVTPPFHAAKLADSKATSRSGRASRGTWPRATGWRAPGAPDPGHAQRAAQRGLRAAGRVHRRDQPGGRDLGAHRAGRRERPGAGPGEPRGGRRAGLHPARAQARPGPEPADRAPVRSPGPARARA